MRGSVNFNQLKKKQTISGNLTGKVETWKLSLKTSCCHFSWAVQNQAGGVKRVRGHGELNTAVQGWRLSPRSPRNPDKERKRNVEGVCRAGMAPGNYQRHKGRWHTFQKEGETSLYDAVSNLGVRAHTGVCKTLQASLLCLLKKETSTSVSHSVVSHFVTPWI